MSGIIPLLLLSSPQPIHLPPVSLTDLHWFPPPAVVQESLRLSRGHIAHLEEIGRFNPYLRDENTARLRAARWRLECWISLDHAQYDGADYDVSWRVDRLNRLRCGLGWSYYSGKMPQPVPER